MLVLEIIYVSKWAPGVNWYIHIHMCLTAVLFPVMHFSFYANELYFRCKCIYKIYIFVKQIERERERACALDGFSLSRSILKFFYYDYTISLPCKLSSGLSSILCCLFVKQGTIVCEIYVSIAALHTNNLLTFWVIHLLTAHCRTPF